MPAVRTYIVEVTTRVTVRSAVSPAAAIIAATGRDDAQGGAQPAVGEARVVATTAREE